MDPFASALIDAMGGTTKVAAMTRASTSTVHSWRRGLTDSRLDHLRRIVRDERLPVDIAELAAEHGFALPDEASSDPVANENLDASRATA